MRLQHALEPDTIIIEEAVGRLRFGMSAASCGNTQRRSGAQRREKTNCPMVQPSISQINRLHFFNSPRRKHDDLQSIGEFTSQPIHELATPW
jgi:hypothetical protein